MNYYQHSIGDYRRDCSHLSLLEHGIYRQLIDWYYLDEKPIPKETQVVYRRLSARTQEEQNATLIILKEFFHEGEDGYRHKRCDAEIDTYLAKAEVNRVNGKLGGRPKKTQVVNVGFENETQNNLNHKPLTINQNINTNVRNDVADDCPHQEIIKLYHEILPMLTQVRSWTAKRASQLKARWREDSARQNLKFWEKFFKYVSGSDFLTGRTGNFTCTLEWLTKSENFVKVIEGNYENKENQ